MYLAEMLLPIKVPHYPAVSYHLLMKSSWSDSSFCNGHPVPVSGSQHTVSWSFIYYTFHELSSPGFTSDVIFISSPGDILLCSQPRPSENPLWTDKLQISVLFWQWKSILMIKHFFGSFKSPVRHINWNVCHLEVFNANYPAIPQPCLQSSF